MTQEEKLNKILSWYAYVNKEEIKHLAEQQNSFQVDEMRSYSARY